MHRRSGTFTFLDMVLHICDDRVPVEQRRQMAAFWQEKFAAKCVCCIGTIPYAMKQAFLDASPFGPEVQTTLIALSRALSWAMSVADVERIHRRSRVLLTTEKLMYPHFAAQHFLHVMRQVAMRSAKQYLALQRCLGDPIPATDGGHSAQLQEKKATRRLLASSSLISSSWRLKSTASRKRISFLRRRGALR